MTSARILIVDDEPAMLRTTARILQSDYEVQTAATPTEALKKAETFSPQLAIVDIRLPKMDGFEVMKALKGLDERCQVILMTGSIYDIDEKLVRAIREEAFYYITKPFDREVLRTLVHRCLALQDLETKNQNHMAHLENQMDEARAFQESMLPDREAQVAGFEIYAAHHPSTELAGDLYDYATVGPGCLAMLIADVVGHGVSAAMLTGIVKSAFHSSHIDDYDPQAVVRRVSEGIASFEYSRFVTLLCARISIFDRRLEYVNAGHDGGLITSPTNPPQPLQATGPIVSPALDYVTWDLNTLDWNTDTQILLYTDGIPEAGGAGEQFGSDQLYHIVQNNPAGGPDLLNTILEQVRQFVNHRPATDDMTLLTARCPDPT